jgi:hypothetical protein
MMSVFLHSIDGCTRAAYLATLLMIVFIYDIKHVCFTQIENPVVGKKRMVGRFIGVTCQISVVMGQVWARTNSGAGFWIDHLLEEAYGAMMGRSQFA